MRRYARIVWVALLCAGPCAWGAATPTLPFWPSVRGGSRNSGWARHPGACKGELVWKAPIRDGAIGSPVVDATGRIFVVTPAQVLTFGPDGRPGRAIALDQAASPASAPALDEQGRLRIVGSKSRRSGILPLPRRVGEAIAAYLRNGRPRSERRELFLRHRAPLT